MSGTRCRVCKNLLLPSCTISLSSDLSDLTKKKSEKLDKFFKSVNGLLNEKGGYVAIHASSTDKIDLFHQKVDERLQRLISEYVTFADVFTLSLKDKKHILYRVKPGCRYRPYSTFDFKTKTSLNKGRGEISNCQVAQILARERYNQRQSCKRKSNITIDFVHEKQPKIRRKSCTEPLHESTTVQVKRVLQDKIRSRSLGQLWWKDFQLGEYISALAKLPEGGSVYIGLAEESKQERKWVSAERSAERVLSLRDPDRWKVWTEQNSRNPSLYFVSERGSRAHEKEVKTGRIITEGVYLNKRERKQFRASIHSLVENNLTYVGVSSPPEHPIEVVFHDVKDAPRVVYVIEIKVENYSGLCFYSADGPELYRSTLSSSSSQLKLEQVEISDWLGGFETSVKWLKETFEEPAQQEGEIRVFRPPHKFFPRRR